MYKLDYPGIFAWSQLIWIIKVTLYAKTPLRYTLGLWLDPCNYRKLRAISILIHSSGTCTTWHGMIKQTICSIHTTQSLPWSSSSIYDVICNIKVLHNFSLCSCICTFNISPQYSELSRQNIKCLLAHVICYTGKIKPGCRILYDWAYNGW